MHFLPLKTAFAAQTMFQTLALAALVITIIFVRNDPPKNDDSTGAIAATVQQETPLELNADKEGTTTRKSAITKSTENDSSPK